jgi:hypothetical protein
LSAIQTIDYPINQNNYYNYRKRSQSFIRDITEVVFII